MSGYERCSSSVGIPLLSNMVLDPIGRPTPVVDRDRKVELSHLWFLSFSYIYGMRGLFHCVWSTPFSQEHFSFHLKMYLFSQDMTISVRSRGIKPAYTLLKFLQSIILVLFRFYIICLWVATLLHLSMLFSPCPVRSRKIKNI